MGFLKTSALLLLLSAPARAKEAGPISYAGYFKNILELSQSPIDGRPWTLDTARLRLTLDGGYEGFKAHVDYATGNGPSGLKLPAFRSKMPVNPSCL